MVHDGGAGRTMQRVLGTKKSKMPSNDTTDDDLLVERFIASFEKLDELIADAGDGGQ